MTFADGNRSLAFFPCKGLDVLILFMLAFVAGFVDAACFLGLSEVFTAHVTGNFASLAASLVEPSPVVGLRLEVVAAFGAGAILARLATRRTATHETLMQRALLLEAALLFVLLLGHLVLNGVPLDKPWIAGFAAAAMGAQSAPSKLARGLPAPTTVMTSNYTQLAIACLDALVPPDAETGQTARRQLAQFLPLVLIFVSGALIGAYGQARYGFEAIGLPLVLVLLALWSAIRGRDEP